MTTETKPPSAEAMALAEKWFLNSGFAVWKRREEVQLARSYDAFAAARVAEAVKAALRCYDPLPVWPRAMPLEQRKLLEQARESRIDAAISSCLAPWRSEAILARGAK